MSDYETRAYQYRQRAEELRAILHDMKDPQTREKIEKLVADYDRLAEKQDALARQNSGGAKP